MEKILIIDDDNDMCLLLNRLLTRKGYQSHAVSNGKAALEWCKNEKPDLVLCDFRLEDTTGASLLKELKALHPHVPVIIITGYSDIKSAVEVIKMGAYDYVTKPLFPDEIMLTIRKALSGSAEENGAAPAYAVSHEPAEPETDRTVRYKAKPVEKPEQYVMPPSPEFANVIKQIDLVAPTDYSVIIYGESGSGKEAIAQQIHKKSKRSDKPFVAIDCGALSRELAGSELFGHEKGAFTGALNQKIGSFEIANEGTIFLDEIANLSYDIQVSLLRVVQERKIKRLGGTKDIPLNVRIIIASNERLWNATKEGKFREDLYHRFNEFNIDVPPLRDRKSDIMFMANHFLKLTNAELGKNVTGFRKEVENIFHNYPWYGNLRELKNVVKRATLLTEGSQIEVQSLPFEITNFQKLQFDVPEANGSADIKPKLPLALSEDGAANKKLLKSANMQAEHEVIMNVLKQTNYNKSKTAKLLNIDRKTLYNKLNQYNILLSK